MPSRVCGATHATCEAETSAQAALDRGMVLKDDRLRELTQLRSSISNRGDEKDQLQQERQQLITVIQDFTATERQLEKDRELSQVCASLAEACPGVCGRVVDLCKPSQKRLHVAVNVALARYLDAVIVDSSDTAKACVRYLKERMLPPMTFLPMTDLRVAGLDPRLQSLVHSQKGARIQSEREEAVCSRTCLLTRTAACSQLHRLRREVRQSFRFHAGRCCCGPDPKRKGSLSISCYSHCPFWLREFARSVRALRGSAPLLCSVSAPAFQLAQETKSISVFLLISGAL